MDGVISTGTQVLRGEQERYLRVTMPWTRSVYFPQIDLMGIGHPQLSMYWSFPPRGFKLRIGLVYDFVETDAQHSG